MSFESESMLFGVSAGAGLIWKSWEGEGEQVLFHSQSGQTHLLDELAAWVVQSLHSESQSIEAVGELMAREFDLDREADGVAQYLSGLVPQLVELGLVEELRQCS